jgi:hypothetical protein
MGEIIIELHLGKRTEKNVDEKLLLALEVVADYVHSVLESDRTVHDQHIVNRLEEQGILHLKEKWGNEKCSHASSPVFIEQFYSTQTTGTGLSFDQPLPHQSAKPSCQRV